MVGLNPVLTCVLAVEDGICRGDAVRDSLLVWLDRESRSVGRSSRERGFIQEVQNFLRQTESLNGMRDEGLRSPEPSGEGVKSIYRQSLFGLLYAGVTGATILPSLKELRLEIESQLELDIKAHVESLPLKMLVPLLLCMFPAFLILLLGPITQNFMESIK